jgi:nucleotide-binding universal stress UspA family protein
MTTPNVNQPIEEVSDLPAKRHELLIAVVGFDGSESAGRALGAAALLIAGRIGTIEIVYVAHIAAGTGMSPDALAESLMGFSAVETDLAEAVRIRLAGGESRWHFQRRDGLIANELIGVADELSRDYGDDAGVIIIVGSAMQTLHHLVGSVPVALVRHARYPALVVP